MLAGIYLKDFRSNVWHYIFCFCGIILSNVFYYCFSKMVFDYFGDGVKDGYQFAEMSAYRILLILVSVLFLIVVLRFYVTSRIESYFITWMLGEPAKLTRLRVTLELLMLWGGSTLAGMALGILAGGILGLFTGSVFRIYWGGLWEVMKFNTIVWSMGSVICFLLISRRGKNRRKIVRKREKGWKWHLAGMLTGIALCMTGAKYYNSSRYAPIDYFRILFLFGIGVYFVVKCGMELVVRCRIRRKHGYFSVPARAFFDVLKRYAAVHFAIYLISFFLLHYVFLMFIDNGGAGGEIDTGWKYPYDLVVCSEEPVGFETEHIEIPYAAVTDHEGRQYIGISASDYERLTGDKPELQKDEVLCILQMKDEKAVFEQGEREITFEETGGTFRMPGGKNEILFCGYQRELLYVAVFQELPDVRRRHLYLFQGESAQRAQQMLEEGRYETNAWIKSELLKEEQEERNIQLFFYSGIALLIILFGNGVMTVLIYMRLPEMKKEREFYSCIGMRQKDMRRKIHLETAGSVLFPNIAAILASILFFLVDMDGMWTVVFVKYLFFYYTVFALIEYMYTAALERLIIEQGRRIGYEKK